jgi:CRISPR-associated protein Cmr2
MTGIHISFGPVQSFISEARRTKDLWSGSYLLSSLARAAVHEVLKAYPNTDSIRPYLDDTDKEALRKSYKGAGIERRIGTFPNLLELLSEIDEEAIAETAVKGWNALWIMIAGESKSLIEQLIRSPHRDTFNEIWNRQVNSLWETYWATGEYTSLVRRKAIRNFSSTPEEGRKCTICGVREILRGDSSRLADVRTFWSDVSKALPSVPIKDDGSERLCAICFIKRAVPETLKKLVDSEDRPFPSTASLALLPWRHAILESKDESVQQAVDRFLGQLKANGAPLLRGLWRSAPDYSFLLDYEGDYFIPEQLRDEKLGHSKEQHARLHEELTRLRAAAKSAGIAEHSPYYAILAMDGDSMGETLSKNPDKKKSLSEEMTRYARNVASIIEDNWGRAIYAGGDDVLALMPAHTVLEAARSLRTGFLEAMRQTQAEPVPTISAGIVFSHLSAPLGAVVSRAHTLLESVAKGHHVSAEAVQEGRPFMKDAFAIETWDRGGSNLQLVKKWESKGAISSRDWVDTLLDIESRFSKDHPVPLTSSFIYSIADTLGRTSWNVSDSVTIQKLFLADYFQSRDERMSSLKKSAEGREQALDLMGELVDLAVSRESEQPIFKAQHLLLPQFLSRGGRP